MKRPLRRAHVVRLMHYYHLVQEQLDRGTGETVSSAHIAEGLELDATLVRKDLAAIGVRGCPRVGFVCTQVVEAIRNALGFEQAHRAIVIGAGRLGGAIASYPGFGKYGLTIVALLDGDPEKIGCLIAGHTVQPLSALAEIVTEHAPDLAVLTVPVEAAQPIADRLVAAGIRSIWNFAPTSIAVPREVYVRHEHLSTGFAELAYHLKRVE